MATTTNSDVVSERKRLLPTATGSRPPNRKVQKMDHREKEKIMRRAAEESKRTFQLQPHQPWGTSPLLSTYLQQQASGTTFTYPLLPPAVNHAARFVTPDCPRPGERVAPPPAGTAYQYPSHRPVANGRAEQPRDTSSPSDDEEEDENTSTSAHTRDSANYQPAPPTTSGGVYPYIYSPLASHHIPSPFLYMYNRSPISPMLFVGSPIAPPSISSIPSVSSSSGCSSMSEGGGAGATQNLSDTPPKNDARPAPTLRVAPDEYHVGVTLPDSVSDDGCDSNPATPIVDAPPQVPSTQAKLTIGTTPNCLRPGGAGMSVITGGGARDSQSYLNSSFSSTSGESLRQNVLPGNNFNGRFHQSNSNERPSSGISSCLSSPSSSRGSTPEPTEHHEAHDQQNTYQSEPHDGPIPEEGDEEEEMFCLVPGRLSLLSATQKYKVTLDEVRRRLSGPECLNASVLGGILRRAKSKNGGHHLRQRLEAKGLSLPAGRRKQTELFLLTSLVEGEAVHLADDFRRLCENYFPHTELAQIIGAQHINTPHVERRISMVQAAQVLVQELQAMVNTVGGPNNLRPEDPCNPYPGLTNFSLLSHGFGNPNISAILSVIQTYFTELLQVYEGQSKPRLDSMPNGQPPFANGGNVGTHVPGFPIGFHPGAVGSKSSSHHHSKTLKRERKDSSCQAKS